MTLGTASAARLNTGEPKLPPIVTLPPGSPPVESISFLKDQRGRGRGGRRNRFGQFKSRDGKAKNNLGQNFATGSVDGRQPRVKSNIQQAQRDRWRRKKVGTTVKSNDDSLFSLEKKEQRRGRNNDDPEDNVVQEATTIANVPSDEKSFLAAVISSRDRRKPRVKSDIEVAKRNRGVNVARNKHVFDINDAAFGGDNVEEQSTTGFAQEDDNVNSLFGEEEGSEPATTEQPRRKPRVKSNIQLAQRNRWRSSTKANRKKLGRQSKSFDDESRVVNFVTTTVSPLFKVSASTVASASAAPIQITLGLLSPRATERNTPAAETTTKATEAAAATTEKAAEEKVESAFEEVQPEVRPDGRRPRVKADIRIQLANSGQDKSKRKKQPLKTGLPGIGGLTRSRAGAGRSIDLDDEGEKNFVANEVINPDDDEPKVRPDGQKPRVKSDLINIGGNGGKWRNRFRHSTKVKSDAVKSLLKKIREKEKKDDGSTPAPPTLDLGAAVDDEKRSTQHPLFTSGQVLNTRAVATTEEPITERSRKGRRRKKEIDNNEEDEREAERHQSKTQSLV